MVTDILFNDRHNMYVIFPFFICFSLAIANLINEQIVNIVKANQ